MLHKDSDTSQGSSFPKAEEGGLFSREDNNGQGFVHTGTTVLVLTSSTNILQ